LPFLDSIYQVKGNSGKRGGEKIVVSQAAHGFYSKKTTNPFVFT